MIDFGTKFDIQNWSQLELNFLCICLMFFFFIVIHVREWFDPTTRDSDAFILASLDDIQSLLDDHILKSQSMRGSPFIAALGQRATDWEEKLINMQDILDVWVKVQSAWMYLEPIFMSEDIMRQMPVEGAKFKAVIFQRKIRHFNKIMVDVVKRHKFRV